MTRLARHCQLTRGSLHNLDKQMVTSVVTLVSSPPPQMAAFLLICALLLETIPIVL